MRLREVGIGSSSEEEDMVGGKSRNSKIFYLLGGGGGGVGVGLVCGDLSFSTSFSKKTQTIIHFP